jgi:hypothetical protein
MQTGNRFVVHCELEHAGYGQRNRRNPMRLERRLHVTLFPKRTSAFAFFCEGGPTDTTHHKHSASTRETRFLDAAVARLIPADELGPRRRQALLPSTDSSAPGAHMGVTSLRPWAQYATQQGYQSRLAAGAISRGDRKQPALRAALRWVFAFLAAHSRMRFYALWRKQIG